MKLGISSYCYSRAIAAGQMDIFDVIKQAAQMGCQQIEILPETLPCSSMTADEVLCSRVRKACADAGLEVSTYSMSGNVLLEGEAQEAEYSRLLTHMKAAAALGARYIRIDLTDWGRPAERLTDEVFAAELPLLAAGAARLCQLGREAGVGVLVENHGLFVNGSDRIRQLMEACPDKDYGLQLDVGNFLCVDEDIAPELTGLLPYARVLHMKDFYMRSEEELGGVPAGWLKTRGGMLLRGSILGQGDMNIPELAALVKQAGFDGYATLEFEGMETDQVGTPNGFAAMKRCL